MSEKLTCPYCGNQQARSNEQVFWDDGQQGWGIVREVEL